MSDVHALWFSILALMLVTYAVLDGFDFGAGIVHLAVAKTDDERRRVLAAIGPFWDGNEVWLIAAGGVFVFAFPRAYAAAFSGLYLPMMIVLWLLVLRGVAIEFRSKVDNPLWRAGWDGVFAFASTVMAIVLGVTVGNIVRGVPLGHTGFFHEDLFAGEGGALDLYTAILGAFAVVTLAAHGATFLAWKTNGVVNARSRALATRAWMLALALAIVATIATAVAQPAFVARVLARPWLWPLPVAAGASGELAIRWLRREPARELHAFFASCTFVASLLLATAGGLFPTLLRSTIDDAFSLDAHNAASSDAGLVTGFVLLAPALVLAVVYFVHLFRSFRGKLGASDHHY